MKACLDNIVVAPFSEHAVRGDTDNLVKLFKINSQHLSLHMQMNFINFYPGLAHTLVFRPDDKIFWDQLSFYYGHTVSGVGSVA